MHNFVHAFILPFCLYWWFILWTLCSRFSLFPLYTAEFSAWTLIIQNLTLSGCSCYAGTDVYLSETSLTCKLCVVWDLYADCGRVESTIKSGYLFQMSVSPFEAVASCFILNASSVIRRGCSCRLLLLLDRGVLIPATAFIGRPCFMTSYHAPVAPIAIGRSLLDTPIIFSPFTQSYVISKVRYVSDMLVARTVCQTRSRSIARHVVMTSLRQKTCSLFTVDHCLL